ncbi:MULTISPECIES: flagellar hook-basal body complex protein FliE [unclassified Photobacterium]|uniref:flagellar hook-basal body complex protein FliE n=1 Tax=unclassified Photobacterium TaxID=2628852 RepID=UPI001B8D6487|nr:MULTISPECIES: flagellar hook-basal body complex protein FliE [unclassified Photobacterium]MDO6705478.1 flagellar hook-basal body complex protein FliE [Photobacterium sp. 1_MG-2023]QUJ68699.1 flagellar hook-basal body complex protein FliE [Photobacterium sp. GJ3]
MLATNLTQTTTAQQLMLDKMQLMQAQANQEFAVKANPLDQQVKPLSFSSAMTGVLDLVNNHQAHASAKMTAVETGKSDDLVGAMIASQKASLSFSALMQVRNKVVGAFEDVMKMPV